MFLLYRTSLSKRIPDRAVFFRGLALVLALASMVVPSTRACDICIRMPAIPFEADHPTAIEVAMATREAADRGEIDLNAPVIAALSTSRHLAVRLSKIAPIRMVTMWSQTGPAKELDDLRLTVDIVFIDAESTCHLDVRGGEVLTDVPRSAPADIRLFTSRAGFQSLFLEGFESCEARALVRLEESDAQLRAVLAQLFAPVLKAPPSSLATL